MPTSFLIRSRWGRVLTLAAVCAGSFFVHGAAPAVSLMESRNFVAAREMVAGGSWLIPTMNQELRLAKPPLPTWAVAAWQQLTGPTEDLGQLRIPAALAATLLVFFFWGLSRELTRDQPGEAAAPGQTAWLAALVLATSLLVITTGREGQWDIFATSLMTGGIWLLVGGWQRVGVRAYGWLAASGLLVGLSFLSKGPVPVYALLLPFLLAYLIGQPQHRRAVRERGPATGVGLLLALLIAGSWPLYIWLHVAPVARAVAHTEISSWGERHVQPLWYYWPFFAFTGLWALVSLASLVGPYARRRAAAFIPYGVALAWLVAGLLLLSVVPEKKERYMLPLMPPLALLVAGLLRYWQNTPAAGRSSTDSWLLRGWGGLLVVVLLALPVAMALTGFPGFGLNSFRWYSGVVVFGGLAAWIGWRGVRPAAVPVLVAGTLATALSVIVLLMPIYPFWEGRRDTPGLAHITDARRHPGLQTTTRWASLDTMHVKQVWGAGRAVPIWHPSLVELGELQQPVGVFSGVVPQQRLPLNWQSRVRVIVLDSFYLGRNQESGHWFVSRIDPINLSKP